MKITIVEVNNVYEYPPVISLVRILLDLGVNISLITQGVDKMPKDLLYNNSIKCICIPRSEGGIISKLYSKYAERKFLVNCIKEEMKSSDILWTTSARTISFLGKRVLEYKNVMQLMELVDHYYYYKGHIELNIDEIARKSWKVVVPEINRSYIQQVLWNLPKRPYVLPNKAFDLKWGDLEADTVEALEVIKKEQRNVLLYLGGIWPDRDLEVFAKAALQLNNYALYVIGSVYSETSKAHIKKLVGQYPVVYLGGFTAPQHLAFLKYAHIGLLPYKPVKGYNTSVLNALYCAPNKIYEYAGFGIPMIGSDVAGLRLPFEEFKIGFTCDTNDVDSVIYDIQCIENNYEEMSANCISFYHATDNKKTVKDIIELE